MQTEVYNLFRTLLLSELIRGLSTIQNISSDHYASFVENINDLHDGVGWIQSKFLIGS